MFKIKENTVEYFFLDVAGLNAVDSKFLYCSDRVNRGYVSFFISRNMWVWAASNINLHIQDRTSLTYVRQKPPRVLTKTSCEVMLSTAFLVVHQQDGQWLLVWHCMLGYLTFYSQLFIRKVLEIAIQSVGSTYEVVRGPWLSLPSRVTLSPGKFYDHISSALSWRTASVAGQVKSTNQTANALT